MKKFQTVSSRTPVLDTTRNRIPFRDGPRQFVAIIFALIICALLHPTHGIAQAQTAEHTVSGVVLDNSGSPLPGATIQLKGSTRGVIADTDGNYTFNKVPEGAVFVVSFLGMETKEVPYNGEETLNIILEAKGDMIDEVTVVAFSKQKKESMVASVSTINPSELKIPASNLTSALGGRISGIISYQRSGEPGADNAEFFVRGVTTFNDYARGPLILIDNVELSANDLARLQPDDIASFSVMKDATATALYGARGANGVILVTTKEGREGPAKLNIRFENSISTPTRIVETVDPVSYMRYHNEAVQTRDPLNPRPYSDRKIESTERGLNSMAYPANDWYKELFRQFAYNPRLNMSLSGGGNVARYYVAGTFNRDNGVLKVDKRNNFNNNISINNIQLRSNVNINVTKTTQMDVRMSGTFEDYNGPINSGTELYNMAISSNPVLFPKYYLPDEQNLHTKHILFGNAKDGSYMNPYAEMTKGYKEYSTMTLVAQIEFKQKLDFITEGLNARVLGSTTRYSYFDLVRAYSPYYYSISQYDPVANTYTLHNLNPQEGTEYLSYSPGGKDINTSFYMEAAMDYNRTFKEKHAVSGLLVYTMRQSLYANQLTLQESLPYRNMGLAGRFTYGYDNRYMLEANFGYNGSERFARNHRFGFFPSVGAGWLISNEKFWGERLKNIVSTLKLKGTYGLVGNDAIGGAGDRFFYLSNIRMDVPGTYGFGKNFTDVTQQIAIDRYANPDITWETSRKLNLGIELGLFNKLTIMADYFTENRTNILMNRTAVPSTMGLQAALRSNVGAAKSHGFEASLDFNHSFNQDMWISVRGNLTYATSKYTKYDQPDYGIPWFNWVGLPLGQPTGFIAERLFIDEADIANSPTQSYGPVMPGDIKYFDVNDDGVINDFDKVPIGYPETPNLIYGLGVSFGYKGFDLSLFFQGCAQSSFFINTVSTAPFLNMNAGGRAGNNAMLQAWADSHWSEENRNSYALWPRLSDEIIDNNNQVSTWWLRDGTYLRLKTAELGYTLPQKLTQKLGIENLRFYISGINLLTFSAFDMWDIEMGGNGLGYPIQRTFNIGLNVNF